ncbi:GDP-mannose 4,6-dehydratase, partial [Patescibacteria group bacterium]|nr:GDP-mannose 4,6-dehydratase [Patescibacteria group bacterium]
GGAGALGSYLVKKYINDGHRVIVIDNLMKTQTTENIDAFMGNKNFKFLKHDINDPIDLAGEKIDWIFNAACPVSCISLQIDPIHTVKSCTLGVINMLELARKHGAKFLQCSSADIYGEMKDHPFKETDLGSTNTLSPRACYEEGKRTAETICMDYHRKYGVEIKIARIFNTAGPHTQMTDGRVPSIFIYNALAQRPIRIYGDGKATRCFLHIEDQVDGLDKFMRTGADVTGPINIGSTDEVTILELAEKVIKKTDSKSEIIFERRDDAPLLRKPDTTLAKNLLGWQQTKSLDELLDDMIAHYKNKGLPESTVLVFSVTYYPDHGPAESALMDLAQKMPETEFHVITSKMNKDRRDVENYDNVTVYRIGFGAKFDKYLLPLLGAIKAKQLNKQYHYRFMWSVMATYGGLIGLVLKLLGNKASFLLMHDDKENLTGWKKKLANYIESKADTQYTTKDGGDDQFIDNIRRNYAELTAKQENKLLRPL